MSSMQPSKHIWLANLFPCPLMEYEADALIRIRLLAILRREVLIYSYSDLWLFS